MFWSCESVGCAMQNRYRATDLRTGRDHVKTQITESPFLACEVSDCCHNDAVCI